MNREDDIENKCHFRSERLFCCNNEWFFATREGDMGPYARKLEAETHLKRFLGEKIELRSFQASRARRIEVSEAPSAVPAIPIESATKSASKSASTNTARVTSLADHLRQNDALNNCLLDRLELVS